MYLNHYETFKSIMTLLSSDRLFHFYLIIWKVPTLHYQVGLPNDKTIKTTAEF